MSDDTIFLVDGSGELSRVACTPYDSEDVLQSWLENHPELIVGEQINGDAPPRWLLIAREAGIPDRDGAADRWALDHLLLDQAGRPTFVEVKRASDTRIRREVIAQMLDYAANAKHFWPTDRIRSLAATTCGGEDALQKRLEELLGLQGTEDAAGEVEAFWQTVDHNLRVGEVRLLFVADAIPSELRRIIEFLNEHMPAIEVLGVEIRQYAGESIRALVPRVVGQTEFAKQEKRSATGPRAKPQVTREEFLERCPGRSSEFFRELLDQAEAQGYSVAWGAIPALKLKPQTASRPVTLFYATDASDSAAGPRLQAYLEYLKVPEVQERFRSDLAQLLDLEASGKHSHNAFVTDDRVDAMIATIPAILQAGQRAIDGFDNAATG